MSNIDTFNDWQEFAETFGTGEEDKREFLNPPKLTPTGIAKLDEQFLNGGMAPGVYVLMAEPGAGKSATAIQVAVNVAARGGKVLYVTAEMTRQQCIARAASSLSAEGDRKGAFRWGDWERMGADAKGRKTGLAAMKHLRERCPGLVFADLKDVGDEGSAEDVAAVAEEGAGAGLDLLVVDYLQWLQSPTYPDGRPVYQDELSCIKGSSRTLCDAAKSLRIPVITVSTMGRAARRSKDADLAGAYGSSGIEYDATGVWQLMRGGEGEDADGARELEFHVVKNRRGPIHAKGDYLTLWHDGAHNRVKTAWED